MCRVEMIFTALHSLKRSPLRSLLTMLGMIIGIGSVIMVSVIGKGEMKLLNKAFKSMGMQTYQLSVNTKDPQLKIGRNVYFDQQDQELLLKNPNVAQMSIYEAISPWSVTAITGKKRLSIREGAVLNLCAVDAAYFSMNTIDPLQGRVLSSSSIDDSSIVIDEWLAKKLYNTTSAVGRTLTLNINDPEKGYSGSDTFLIVGVVESAAKLLATTQGKKKEGGYISYALYILPTPFYKMTGKDKLSSLMVEFKDSENSAQVSDQIIQSVAALHHVDERFYTLEKTNQRMEQAQEQMKKMNLFVSLIAAISLLVGGIGVMNIMLVSVTERTKEIGVRKALGATAQHILWQFLIESVVLTVIGGLAGVVGGITAGKISTMIMQLPMEIDFLMLTFCVGISMSIGIFFGVYPAVKASQLDPIEALRHE